MTNDELNPNDETRNDFGRSTSDPSSFGLCHFFVIRIFFEVPQITVLDMTSQDGYTSSRHATF